MNKDLIVYSGVSAAIIACFGVCTWTLTRQAQTLIERMDVMDRRLSAMQEAVVPASRTANVFDRFDSCDNHPNAPEPPWCKDPIVAPAEDACTGAQQGPWCKYRTPKDSAPAQ